MTKWLSFECFMLPWLAGYRVYGKGVGKEKLERNKAPGRKYVQRVWRTDDVAWTRAVAVKRKR